MDHTSEFRRGRLQGLALSQLLELLFLAGCVWWIYCALELVLGAQIVTESIAWRPSRDSVLTARLRASRSPHCWPTSRSGSRSWAFRA
jgi:hypothetical protein